MISANSPKSPLGHAKCPCRVSHAKPTTIVSSPSLKVSRWDRRKRDPPRIIKRFSPSRPSCPQVCFSLAWPKNWLCNAIVVNSLDGQFSPPFAPPTPPPTFPSPPPPSTPNICFLILTCLAHLFFLTLHPHTAQSTSSWLYTFLFSFISSLCSAWYFCHNSLTFSALFPAHFSLWARHPLQVAFPPRNISNPLCPLHFQHCFFSTSSTTISPHAIPCFVVFKCFPQLLFLIWQSHTSQ